MNGSQSYTYDLCIIGGGINGTGIARDAAGSGLKVLLLEQGDLAHATSSASTKLIHGGLRYLEYYEFRLVHEALRERDVLLNIAPHIIWPMNFVLPDAYTVRPFWLVRCGLYLYDLLSLSFHARKFPLSRSCNLRNHEYGLPLKDKFSLGALYSDGWVQDARLSVLNAMDAKAKGADIKTRTRATDIEIFEKGWKIGFENRITGLKSEATARIVVNAAGPWVRDFLDGTKFTSRDTPRVRLVQGSHIIVPKLYEGTQAYMLQQPDKRIIFAIPYENDFTLIGTTDRDYQGDAAQPQISREETDYLIAAVNIYFKKQIAQTDIVATYSGVRPLLADDKDDAKEVTRDYKIHEDIFDHSRLISVFGGKITTYRKLAESVMHKISHDLKIHHKSWTGKRALPGGDISFGDFEAYLKAQKIVWKLENVNLLKRYGRAYGTKMDDILSAPKGVHYGDQMYEAEIRYLIANEFALTMDDILWRRSKMKLHVSEATRANLKAALPYLVKEITGYDITNYSGD